MMPPLVSVPVITYNSSKFVIETLESIKNQTYQNIELIVSDDGSTDNTVELCKDWIERNQSRFSSVELLTVEHNTGIPANCNRGEMAAKGVFVKTIAGDDYLSSDYLERVVQYFETHDDFGAVFTNSILVYEDCNKKEVSEDVSGFRCGEIFDDLFLLKYWPKAPSWIFRKSVLEKIGYNDESIWVEDYLKILKIAKKWKIGWVDEYLTYYRLHGDNSGGQSIRLLESQMKTIDHFKDHPKYGIRRRDLQRTLFSLAEFEDCHYLDNNWDYTKFLINEIRVSIKKLFQYNFPKLRKIYKSVKAGL